MKKYHLPQLAVPVAPELKQWVQEQARREHRTMAGQIRHLLEQQREREQQAQNQQQAA